MEDLILFIVLVLIIIPFFITYYELLDIIEWIKNVCKYILAMAQRWRSNPP